MPRRKQVIQRTLRFQCGDYFRGLGIDTGTRNTHSRASTSCQRPLERQLPQRSRDSQQSASQPTVGTSELVPDPSPSTGEGSGTAGSEAHVQPPLDDPCPGDTACADQDLNGSTSHQDQDQPEPTEGAGGDPSTRIHLPDLRTTQGFIDTLQNAALTDSGMEEDDIYNMRDPGPIEDFLDPSPLLRSVRHFINNASASRGHYENTRMIELLNNPGDPFLSFDQVKRRVRWLSGVVPIEHDMCLNTCIAYTGPYRELDACPYCSTSRYIPGSKKAQRRFSTIPIGPVVQALYGSHEIAEQMHYLEQKLAENLNYARLNNDRLDSYDDTACGNALLDAWRAGSFKKSDVALQFSIDGAQLRPDQPSEAWIFIWIIHNLPPGMRYKKAFVIPAAIVPGPSKPREIDSFIFPSLYHVAALQREGLRIYDAFLGAFVPAVTPCVFFATVDSLGNASMSGMVGHSGKYGCRLYCDMPSRRRRGDTHYYPVMKQPLAYDVPGCCHADITAANLHRFRCELPQKYKANLGCLLLARTQADYKTLRLEVGLCKQTLISGLPHQPVPVPSVFMMDIMHLSVLNDPDLFLKLFTGKLDVYAPDDRSTWDWAIFYQNPALWSAHGETVSMAVPFIPSSFGRAPRDPAKKINSGYKAWEFQQYIYGLGPALFRHILPQKYWLYFCKLVSGIRLLQRHTITHQELLEGHAILMDFVSEFEDLYYQQMESRIHFVRQSIHLLTHIALETLRAGPLACYSQWTLETAIGNLGREIRQDRDIFANLTQRAILRAQVNSLQARFPKIRIEVRGGQDSLPVCAREFEDCPGYALLPRREEYPTPLQEDELQALKGYWHEQGWPNPDSWENGVCRWAKLLLPTGQRARSTWHEAGKLRRASCVEVMYTTSCCNLVVLNLWYRFCSGDTHGLQMFSFIFICASEISSFLCQWCLCFHSQTWQYSQNQATLFISALHWIVHMVLLSSLSQLYYLSCLCFQT